MWQGAQVRKADGSYGTVQAVKVVQHQQVMYNLTVADAHPFFVGNEHFLVHNTCAASNSPNETVYRFSTRIQPETRMSNLSKANKFTQKRVNFQMRFKFYREWRANKHMEGATKNSPFVSVVHDPGALANSTHSWARTIVTGEPGMRGVKRAPDIGEFSVPSSNLFRPKPANTLSTRETEMLY